MALVLGLIGLITGTSHSQTHSEETTSTQANAHVTSHDLLTGIVRVTLKPDPEPHTKPPPELRVPAGWRAFAVGADAIVLKSSHSGMPPQPIAAGWLRLTTAIDDRRSRAVDVSIASTGRPLGRIDLRFAPALSIAQLALPPDLVVESLAGGILLRLCDDGPALWFIYPASAANEPPEELQPHIMLAPGDTRPISAFQDRLGSLASLQPFGWMEGCVLEGLRALATTTHSSEHHAAIRDHWQVFLPGDGSRLVFEDPKSRPCDDRINSIEAGLPFADLALRDPDNPHIDQFLEFARQRLRANGSIQDGDMLSAEGSYTIAYPLAVIASVRNRPDLAALAVDQLKVRRDRLWHDGALWLRSLDDGTRTFRGWARGNAWHALGVCRSIEQLRTHVATRELEDELRRCADWLMPLQRPDGLWACFVEDTNEPPDTSGSAGIATALACGYRLGILPASADEAARRTLKSILRNHLTPDGFLERAAPSNRGGEKLQRSDYRVISQMGMGLLAQLLAECDQEIDEDASRSPP